MKPYPAAISGVAEQSSRVVESLVNVGNGTNMFVACLYGPTHNTTFFDPWALLSAACKETFDHALHFLILGPCCLQLAKRLSIMLWLSRVLQSSWVILTWSCVRFQDGMPYKEAGWIDAALFDADRRGTSPSHTSKDKARKSFILVNAQLV